jgi:hypothetical protein
VFSQQLELKPLHGVNLMQLEMLVKQAIIAQSEDLEAHSHVLLELLQMLLTWYKLLTVLHAQLDLFVKKELEQE